MLTNAVYIFCINKFCTCLSCDYKYYHTSTMQSIVVYDSDVYVDSALVCCMPLPHQASYSETVCEIYSGQMLQRIVKYLEAMAFGCHFVNNLSK